MSRTGAEIPASQECREPDRGMDRAETESRGAADEAGHANDRELYFIMFGFVLLINLLQMRTYYRCWFVTVM